MKIEGTQTRSIWPTPDGSVEVIDQTKLPHRFATVRLSSMADAIHAINSMVVRGAPLIGATGAYGLASACAAILPTSARPAHDMLFETRPTAVICAGRSTAFAMRCAIVRAASAPRRRGERLLQFATTTLKPAAASASTASHVLRQNGERKSRAAQYPHPLQRRNIICMAFDHNVVAFLWPASSVRAKFSLESHPCGATIPRTALKKHVFALFLNRDFHTVFVDLHFPRHLVLLHRFFHVFFGFLDIFIQRGGQAYSTIKKQNELRHQIGIVHHPGRRGMADQTDPWVVHRNHAFDFFDEP